MPYSEKKLIDYAKSGDYASFTKELENASPKTNHRDNLNLLHTLYTLSSTPNMDVFADTIIAKEIRVSMIDTADNSTWIHHAIYNEKVTALKWYLTASDAEQALKLSCPTSFSSTHMTPIELANRIKSKDIYAILINLITKTSPPAKKTDSPLSIALKQKSKDQFGQLIKDGAQNESIKAELPTLFAKAAKESLYDYAKSCIDAGMSVAKKNAAGTTPLFDAIQSGDPKAIELTLQASDAKAAINIACLHQSPLDLAFERGDEATIQKLHQFGAKFHHSQASAPEQKNTRALNRLIFVIKNNDREEFNKFLHAIKTTDHTNKPFDIEIFEAMQYCIEQYETRSHYLKELLDKRRQLITPSPTKTPLEPLLHIAVRLQNNAALDLLLKTNDAAQMVNQTYKGKTIADIALSNNNVLILDKITPFKPAFTKEDKPTPAAHTTEHRSLLTQQLDTTSSDSEILDTLLTSKALIEKEALHIGIRPIEIALINEQYIPLVKLYNACPTELTRGLAMVGFDKIKPLKKQSGKCKDDGPLQLYLSMITIPTAEKEAFQELYQEITESKFRAEDLDRLARIKGFKSRLHTYIMKNLSETDQFDTLCHSVRDLKSPLYIIWNAARTEKPDVKAILKDIESINKSLKKKKLKEPLQKETATPRPVMAVAPSAPLEGTVIQHAIQASQASVSLRQYEPVPPVYTSTMFMTQPVRSDVQSPPPSSLRECSLFPTVKAVTTSAPAKSAAAPVKTRLQVVSLG